MPVSSLISLLPFAWVPYAELGRFDKPVGFLNIAFPYLYGAVYGSILRNEKPQVLFLRLAILLCSGSILRSAGCSWNDIIDKDVDRLVKRSRSRPLARGALSVSQAGAFTAILFTLWLISLTSLSSDHWKYSIPLIAMVLSYPFAKRYTNYAQVALGLTLSYGVIIGASIGGLSLVTLSKSSQESSLDAGNGLAELVCSYTLWSVLHDTIYAQQDIEDDLKANIKSLPVKFRGHIRLLLFTLSFLLFVINWCIGCSLSAPYTYYMLACVFNGLLCLYMANYIKLDKAGDCARWFHQGSLIYGTAYFAAMLSCYCFRQV